MFFRLRHLRDFNGHFYMHFQNLREIEVFSNFLGQSETKNHIIDMMTI